MLDVASLPTVVLAVHALRFDVFRFFSIHTLLSFSVTNHGGESLRRNLKANCHFRQISGIARLVLNRARLE